MWIISILSLFLLNPASADEQLAKGCWGRITVEGVINVGSYDYINRALKHFDEQKCQAVLMRINTPGGSLETTRLIVEDILQSPLPVLCLVAPSGGHAGSAGAIILQACHLNGALSATNVGAATPILSSGQDILNDLRKKIVEDTASWVVGLAKLRGRDQIFAEEIITKAKSLDAESAHKKKAIDFFGSSEEDFMNFATQHEIKMDENKTIALSRAEVKDFPMEFRSQLLQLFGDPEIAYLLFMGSLALLYFELTHTGAVLPGIIGSLGLVFSLMAFHKLQMDWGGVALIVLGVLFMVLELFITSFGALAIGGVASLFLGSMYLFERGDIVYGVPWKTVIPVVFATAASVMGITFLAAKTLRLKRNQSQGNCVGKVGELLQIDENATEGQISLQGEIWKCRAMSGALQLGKKYKVIEQNGLMLIIKSEEL